MKDLIYFPYFEPQNTAWLKFALLYIDNYKPIIPNNREEELSPLHKQIFGDTDLIKPYKPNYDDGASASTKTKEQLKQLLNNRKNNSYLFNHKNILTEARNKRNYLIYREKFSYEFEDFCLEHNLGDKVDEGLILSEEFAYIFMSNLAKEIANKTDSSIITDSSRFNKYNNFAKVYEDNTIHKHLLARQAIELKVPQNIEEIEFKELIKFRNKNRDLLKIFNHEINKFYENDFTNNSPYEFIRHFDEIYTEVITKISILGVGLLSIPLSGYLLINNSNPSEIESLKELSSAMGMGGLGGGALILKEILTSSKNKRNCNKYFANLSKLK